MYTLIEDLVTETYNFKAALLRLTLARNSTNTLYTAIQKESVCLPLASPRLFQSADLLNVPHDAYSNLVLQRCVDLQPQYYDYVAVATSGDGNCMFNAISMLITGVAKI